MLVLQLVSLKGPIAELDEDNWTTESLPKKTLNSRWVCHFHREPGSGIRIFKFSAL